MIFLIGSLIVISAIAIFAWRDKRSVSKVVARYRAIQSHRKPISAQIFAEKAAILPIYVNQIDKFRNAFSEAGLFDPNRIYPEDDISDLGFIYDDTLAMFLFEKTLLKNKDYRYSFPLEDASCFSDVITITQRLNSETEQGAAANP